MKKSTKIIIALGACLLVAAVVMGVLFFTMGPKGQAGDKTIEVEVVMADGTGETFTYKTDSEMLGDVLLDEKLVEGDSGEFGLFITAVNGVQANVDNQEWWCITKGGEMVMTGADMTPIADGDHFEITLTVGYDLTDD